MHRQVSRLHWRFGTGALLIGMLFVSVFFVPVSHPVGPLGLTAALAATAAYIGYRESCRRRRSVQQALILEQAESRFDDGDYAGCIDALETILRSTPGDNLALDWRGLANLMTGNYVAAYRDFSAALRSDPTNSYARMHLAYIMATCPDASLRDGHKAVELAEELSTSLADGQQWLHLTLLAAAYAEVGAYEQAVATYERALELAPPEERDKRQETLERYRNKQPYRASPESHAAKLFV